MCARLRWSKCVRQLCWMSGVEHQWFAGIRIQTYANMNSRDLQLRSSLNRCLYTWCFLTVDKWLPFVYMWRQQSWASRAHETKRQKMFRESTAMPHTCEDNKSFLWIMQRCLSLQYAALKFFCDEHDHQIICHSLYREISWIVGQTCQMQRVGCECFSRFRIMVTVLFSGYVINNSFSLAALVHWRT